MGLDRFNVFLNLLDFLKGFVMILCCCLDGGHHRITAPTSNDLRESVIVAAWDGDGTRAAGPIWRGSILRGDVVAAGVADH